MRRLIAVAIVAISALDFCSSVNGRLWTFERFAVTHRLRLRNDMQSLANLLSLEHIRSNGLPMAKTNSLLRLSTSTNGLRPSGYLPTSPCP